MRDVTAKIRAIELFNLVGFPSSGSRHPPLTPLSRSLPRRLPFTLSPSNFRPGSLPSSLFLSSSFSFSLFFSSLFLYRVFCLSLSLSGTFLRPHHLRSLMGPSLFCHGTLVRAVPLYLPPPVVPSSLKAVGSNRWHRGGLLVVARTTPRASSTSPSIYSSLSLSLTPHTSRCLQLSLSNMKYYRRGDLQKLANMRRDKGGPFVAEPFAAIIRRFHTTTNINNTISTIVPTS